MALTSQKTFSDFKLDYTKTEENKEKSEAWKILNREIQVLEREILGSQRLLEEYETSAAQVEEKIRKARRAKKSLEEVRNSLD